MVTFNSKDSTCTVNNVSSKEVVVNYSAPKIIISVLFCLFCFLTYQI